MLISGGTDLTALRCTGALHHGIHVGHSYCFKQTAGSCAVLHVSYCGRPVDLPRAKKPSGPQNRTGCQISMRLVIGGIAIRRMELLPRPAPTCTCAHAPAPPGPRKFRLMASRAYRKSQAHTAGLCSWVLARIPRLPAGGPPGRRAHAHTAREKIKRTPLCCPGWQRPSTWSAVLHLEIPAPGLQRAPGV